MPFALKFKLISTEQCTPKQMERSQTECKKKKKLTTKSQIVET